MKALTVRQPWAALIIHGGKDVENRTWRTNYRGRLLIHAASSRPDVAHDVRLRLIAAAYRMDYGGVLGSVAVVDCVTDYDSEWAMPGMWHWVLADPEPLPFDPCPGRLGLWDYPALERTV